MKNYADYAWAQTARLLDIDSPTGFTDRAATWVRDAFAALGYETHITNKGGVIADLGGPTPWAAWWPRSNPTDTCV